jgi:hypothetical protein
MNRKRMRFPFIIVALLIFLSITLTVMAQGADGQITSQLESSDIVSGSSFDTNFTFTDISYLPILFKDYTPCITIPTLIYPTNESNIDTLIPLFSWNNGNDPNATESIVVVTGGMAWSVSSYYQPGVYSVDFPWNLDPGTTYYWKARLTCKNTPGRYSEVWSFTTSSNGTILPPPSLISPASGSTVSSVTVTLQWSAVPGATGYGVQWIKAGQGWTNIMDVTETHAHLNYLAYNSSYEWWIRAKNDYAYGDDSAHWYFYTPSGLTSFSPQAWIQRFEITDNDSQIIYVEQENNNR